MKFWDTIAKMCGIKVDASSWAAVSPGAHGSCDGWRGTDRLNLDAGRHSVEVTRTLADVTVAINGHGLRLRDSTAFANSSRATFMRLGFIDVERISPMKGQSGSVHSAAESMERMAKAARPNATDLPS